MIALASPLQKETLPISKESVLAALDGLLLKTRPLSESFLDGLLLIDEASLDQSLPLSICSRGYILSSVLISLITDELFKYRRANDRADLEPERSRDAALATIARDARPGNCELLGWSWLYYHYVRVDLGITTASFCRSATITQRTLHRYYQRALYRLVSRLIDMEQRAHRAQRKRRLYAQLPTFASPLHLGRERALEKSYELLTTLQPRHIMVAGRSGIGKTAFVQTAIRSLIDSEAIEYLLWLDAPTSHREIHYELDRFLHARGVNMTLGEFLQKKPTAFVFDGIDALSGDHKQLRDLLAYLSPAVVFLTARMPLLITPSMGYILLSELSEPDSLHLIRRLVDRWHVPGGTSLSSSNIQDIYTQARGNPRAIARAVFDLQLQQAY